MSPNRKTCRNRFVQRAFALLCLPVLFALSLWIYCDARLSQLDAAPPSIGGAAGVRALIEQNGLGRWGLPVLPEFPMRQSPVWEDSGVFNLLLLGTDDSGESFSREARADSILLASADFAQHTIRLVSLERGMAVPIPGQADDWLTHAFRYGGADLMLRTVRSCFAVEVERYVRVNFATFIRAVDAIGGVELELSVEEAAALRNGVLDPVRYPLQAGLNHLDGYAALQYARLRSIDSDWKRVERQRAVIQAAADKVRSLNPRKLDALASQILPLVQTNLSRREIAALLLRAPAFLGVHIEQLTLPVPGSYRGEVGHDGRLMTVVDFQQNARVLQDFLYGTTVSVFGPQPAVHPPG